LAASVLIRIKAPKDELTSNAGKPAFSVKIGAHGSILNA